MEDQVPAFNVTDFVWAKVTGYPYWPAIIMEPDPQAPQKPENSYWIYFFGSHNYSWIQQKYLKPFDEHKKKYKNKCSQSVMEAYKELRWNQKQLARDPEFKMDFVKFIVKGRKSRPRAKSVRSRKSSVSSYRSRRRKMDDHASSISTRTRSPLSEYTYENMEEEEDSDDFQSLQNDEIIITKEPIGVFACNIYAEAFTKNLVGFGHNLLVWSPSEGLCTELKQLASEMGTYFKEYKSLRELAKRAAIIFSCFTCSDEAKAILYELGADDKNDNILRGKIYIEMTTIDYETSYTIENFLNKKRAGYMEAMIQGTRKEAQEREIIVLVGGRRDKAQKILTDYKSCFWALGKATYLVGEIGSATKIHAMIQMMKALFLAGFTEALALADKCIDLNVFMQIFETTQFSSVYFQRVCDIIKRKEYFNIQETLQSLQQDLAEFLSISNKVRQAAPMAAAANQLYKHARRIGFDDRDSACMFLRAK